MTFSEILEITNRICDKYLKENHVKETPET